MPDVARKRQHIAGRQEARASGKAFKKLTEVQSVTEASLASTSKKGRTTQVYWGCELPVPYSEILLTFRKFRLAISISADFPIFFG